MSLAMVAPTRHPKSGVYRIRLTIPEPLRDTTARLYGVRRELTQTLGTKDPREAKRLAPPVIQSLQGKLRAAEADANGQTTSLTDREISALCGRWLAKQEALTKDTVPEPIWVYEERLGFLADVLQGTEVDEAPNMLGDAAVFMEADINSLLSVDGLSIDAASHRRLVSRLAHVQWRHWGDLVTRIRSGSWKQTVSSADFAAPSARGSVSSAGAATFDALLAGWAADRSWRLDAKPMPRPLYDRIRTIERLATFLGHRDASKVGLADAVRWKAEMQGRDLHASTVRNDLSEMSAIWKWGVANDLVPDNPFSGILPKKAKKRGTEVRGFTEAEAKTILETARQERGYLRWVPWVLCATGARLNEIAQSSKADVMQIEGVWAIRIDGRPLARSGGRVLRARFA